MIAFIKSWCEGIIVAVMISIIIELLIPEGNNKKYVKVVIGIYILFVIISPILEKINIEYEFDDFLGLESIEVSTDINNDIKDVYVDGIEETIKNEITQKGYLVKNKSQNEILVEPVNIVGSKVAEDEYWEIKEMLAQNYNVNIEKIYIY